MKSIVRDCATVCYALLFLASTKSLAQQTFILSPEDSKQISRYVRDCKIYPVSQGEVMAQSAYIADEKPINSNVLSGKFVKLSDDYILVRADVAGMFVKNELTTDLKGQYNRGYDKRYPLVQNTDSKQFYYIMSDEFLPTVDIVAQQRKQLEALHKLGYKEYEKEGEMYIKSKTAEIKLDAWTYGELKQNPSYIATLDNDQIKIAGLVKQSASHSKMLDKYISLYNIKKNKTSTAEINAWRTATTNAKKLNEQIYKLNKKYEGNYSFTLLDKSNTLDVFLDNLRASKGVLGM